jgi:hypothetical protein
LLPVIDSRKLDLLDDARLLTQLVGLGAVTASITPPARTTTWRTRWLA